MSFESIGFDTGSGFGLLPGGEQQLNAINQELNKALTAGYGTSSPGSFTPLIYEDLSPTLAVLTSTRDDLLMWNMLPKEGTKSTVAQYNQLLDYGDNPDGSFIGEIDLPAANTANYNRRADFVKYMGEQGQVSIAATQVAAIQDAMTRETEDCTERLLRNWERNIFKSDSSFNPLAFDGYEKLILTQSPASNIYDMHGAAVTDKELDAAIGTVRDAPNHGKPTHFWQNIRGKQQYNRSYNPAARIILDGTGSREINYDFERYTSSAGSVQLVGSTFINPGTSGKINPRQNFTLVPGAPVVDTAAAAGAPAAGVTSNFLASDTGAYLYYLQGANKFGKSPLVPLTSAPLNVTAGQVVTASFHQGAGASPDFYYILRTPKNASAGTQWEIQRVANVIGSSGPVSLTMTDTNFYLPGTCSAYLFQMDPRVMSWIQLLPLMKMDLGRMNTSYQFMELLFGVPSFKAPGRFYLFRNCAILPQ